MKSLYLAVSLLALAPVSASADLVDGVAAIVDKDVILLSEVDFAANLVVQRLERMRGPVPPEMTRQIRADALESLIDAKLIERFAERVNMAAEPEEIDTAIANIAADEGVSVEEVYAAAAREGMTRNAYRRELGAQITRMKVISGSVRSRVTVSQEEVQALYEERYGSQEPGMRVRARHILLPWPEERNLEKDARMREIAEMLRERAIETGDFATLAQQYSRAPSAADGGLTTFREGEIAPEIAVEVFRLPPGEFTSVIETAHGLNLFQILNRFDPAEVALSDVEANLYAEIVERKTMPEFEKWIRELRANRYIEVVAPELR